jgi:hypothetical protein
MTGRGGLVTVIGTVFLVFVLPYVLAVFGLAPNGTETLLLIVLLWAGSWVFARRGAAKRRESDP